MIARFSSLVIGFATVAIALQQQLVLAEDTYSQGCLYYKSGNYNAALSSFLRAEAAYPNNAVVHYQLGNTFLQMHRRSEAKEEYQKCMTLRPDPTTASYCTKMIDYLAGSSGGSSISKSSGSEKPARDPAAPPPINDGLAARKEEILRKAQTEANAIRAEADKTIREMSENTNQRVYDTQSGELKTGIGSVQAEQIKADAEERANKILEQARDKADHMH